MDFQDLVNKIIPPSDYQHRNGFDNKDLINQLNQKDKSELENVLIKKLETEPSDMLIVETLAYLKSEKSLNVLYALLASCTEPMNRIIISSSIFEIKEDKSLIDLAASSLTQLDNSKDPYFVYKLTSAFYYLVKFKSDKIKQSIRSYIGHKEHLVSYNAKRALEV